LLGDETSAEQKNDHRFGRLPCRNGPDRMGEGSHKPRDGVKVGSGIRFGPASFGRRHESRSPLVAGCTSCGHCSATNRPAPSSATVRAGTIGRPESPFFPSPPEVGLSGEGGSGRTGRTIRERAVVVRRRTVVVLEPRPGHEVGPHDPVPELLRISDRGPGGAESQGATAPRRKRCAETCWIWSQRCGRSHGSRGGANEPCGRVCDVAGLVAAAQVIWVSPQG
jgi:hypothetical protein